MLLPKKYQKEHNNYALSKKPKRKALDINYNRHIVASRRKQCVFLLNSGLAQIRYEYTSFLYADPT